MSANSLDGRAMSASYHWVVAGSQQTVTGSVDGGDLSAHYWWTATGSRQIVTGWWRPLSDVSVNGMKSAKHHSMADSMSASC